MLRKANVLLFFLCSISSVFASTNSFTGSFSNDFQEQSQSQCVHNNSIDCLMEDYETFLSITELYQSNLHPDFEYAVIQARKKLQDTYTFVKYSQVDLGEELDSLIRSAIGLNSSKKLAKENLGKQTSQQIPNDAQEQRKAYEKNLLRSMEEKITGLLNVLPVYESNPDILLYDQISQTMKDLIREQVLAQETRVSIHAPLENGIAKVTQREIKIPENMKNFLVGKVNHHENEYSINLSNQEESKNIEESSSINDILYPHFSDIKISSTQDDSLKFQYIQKGLFVVKNDFLDLVASLESVRHFGFVHIPKKYKAYEAPLLSLLIAAGRYEAAGIVIERSSMEDLTLTDEFGNTPAHVASIMKAKNILDRIVKKDLSLLSVRNKNGETVETLMKEE